MCFIHMGYKPTIFLIRNLISDDDMLPGAAAAVSRVEDPSYGFPSVDPTL